MKIIAESSDLLRGLKQIKGVVERRNTIPILANVLIDVSNERVTFKGTDLDMEVSFGVKAQIESAGTLTVNADTLYTFVSKLPKGSQVKLEADDEKGTLRIACGRSRCSLPTLAATDFPDFNVGDISHNFTIPVADIVRLFGKAQFAISTEETRYYLNGIYLHSLGGKLCAVATDGHRLAKIEGPLPDGADGMPGIIVPRKTVAQALNFCQGMTSVEVGVSQAKIVFKFGDVVLASKLIDGTYPDYARVIPIGQHQIAVGDLGDIAAACGRVSTVSLEKGRTVKLSFTEGQLVLSVTNTDAGSATEELEVEYDGAAIDIGFNARYLGDSLAQIDQKDVCIALTDPSTPAMLRGKDDQSAIFLIMPMRC